MYILFNYFIYYSVVYLKNVLKLLGIDIFKGRISKKEYI